MGTTSNSSNHWKYQIFLNFRGKDTRNSFTDHLLRALKRAGFKIYKDDEGLQKGEAISDVLTAIEESLLSVVILSEDYASSTWCLTELVKILESRDRFGRKVLPIFYGIDPSVVRYQTGRFEEAFEKHAKRCGEDRKKVQQWREALKEVANLCGFDSRNRMETKLIEEIVADIWMKLQPELPSFSNGLVGIDSRVKYVYSLLEMWLPDTTHFLGICGMGGIGKTTLADVVFTNLYHKFEMCCFLANVTKFSGEKGEGLVKLQRELLAPLKIESMEIKTLKRGQDIIRNQLCRKKVLLVLDDVSTESQLKNLAGNKEWFGPGSRIIVTTRDMQLLKSHGISATYEVDYLDMDESLLLFCQKVFKSEPPPEHLFELSNFVVEQAGGLPLAVVVLGSFLCDRDTADWKDAVNLLKQDPLGDIQKILRISYDNLQQMEKDIFLDIACFFVGESKDYVRQILESRGFLAKLCIDVLIEKSLLTCDENGYLRMHDLLQEMGRSIAGEERSSKAAKWSRLWSIEDMDQVFRNNMVNESEAIALKLPSRPREARWDPKVLSNMHNLRLLIVSSESRLSRGLKSLPSELKVLIWKNYPSKDLSLDVRPDKLVWLEMPNSKIRQNLSETQLFSELTFLDLSDSKDLTKLPSLSGTPKLKRLYLRRCEGLVEVDPSFGKHQKLVGVDFHECRNLRKFPIKLEMISLEELSLNGCSGVRKLPEFGENMGALKDLILDGTAIAELPQSLGYLTGLTTLSLKCCKDIIHLPSIVGLPSLSMLRLCGCILTYESIPQDLSSIVTDELVRGDLGILAMLKYLGMSWNDFVPFLGYLKTNGENFVNIPCGGILTYESIPQDLSSSVTDEVVRGDPVILTILNYLRMSRNNFVPLLGYLKTNGENFVNIPCCCISKVLKLRQLYLAKYRSLKSVPKLPTYIQQVSPIKCGKMEPCPSYALRKSGFLTTIKFKKAEPRPYSKDPLEFQCLSRITGDEIPAWLIAKKRNFPAWFDNLNHFVEDRTVLKGLVPDHLLSKSSAVSIIEDIPDFCHGNKCWMIFECLVFDDLVPSHCEDLKLYCCSQAVGDDKTNQLGNVYVNCIRAYHCPYILIICCRINGWPYDQKKLKLTFYTRPTFGIVKRRGQKKNSIFAQLVGI